jgi:hypothetical protein
MRWENGNVAKSAQEFEVSLLAERVNRLERRLAALEKNVSKPSDDGVIDLSQSRYSQSSEGDGGPIDPPPVTARRGRTPLIPRVQLERQRDDLINFIEPRWPDLVRHMRTRKGLEPLLQTLKNVSPGAETIWPYLHLTENIGALWEFLQSGRYKGEPRQIAYAMAGVPEMTWRSSLDACTKHPSRLHINLPAFKDHIRRHNPELLRSLVVDGATEGNLRQLAKHCAECRRVAARPELVLRALVEGEPLIVHWSEKS